MNTLHGHTSPETAYLVDDYPYGFTLRCKIRYWIETSPKHGMRFCSQTTNPKKLVEHWNASKKSTYYDLLVMYLDENSHVKCSGMSFSYDDPEKLLAYIDEHFSALTSYNAEAQIKYGRLIALTRKNMKILTNGENIFDIPKDQHTAIILQARKNAIEQLKAY